MGKSNDRRLQKIGWIASLPFCRIRILLVTFRTLLVRFAKGILGIIAVDRNVVPFPSTMLRVPFKEIQVNVVFISLPIIWFSREPVGVSDVFTSCRPHVLSRIYQVTARSPKRWCQPINLVA